MKQVQIIGHTPYFSAKISSFNLGKKITFKILCIRCHITGKIPEYLSDTMSANRQGPWFAKFCVLYNFYKKQELICICPLEYIYDNNSSMLRHFLIIIFSI